MNTNEDMQVKIDEYTAAIDELNAEIAELQAKSYHKEYTIQLLLDMIDRKNKQLAIVEERALRLSFILDGLNK